MAISTPATLGTAVAAGASTTITLTTTDTVPAGGKIWLVCGNQGAGTHTASGGGLTWRTDQDGTNVNTAFAICSADAPSGLASSTVLTITFSGSVADRFVCGMYSTGVLDGASSDYGSVSQNQSVAAWSSTTALVTDGDILIGGSRSSQASGSPTSTAGGGNTEMHDFSAADGESLTSVYQFGTGAAIAASGTWTGSAWTNRSGAVAYSAAGGGADMTMHPVPAGMFTPQLVPEAWF